MREGLVVRPMKTTDAGGVYRTSSEALPETPEEREEVGRRSAEEVRKREERYLRSLKHDPGGAFVAADGRRGARAGPQGRVDSISLRRRGGLQGRWRGT
jgi:hypothetical protein